MPSTNVEILQHQTDDDLAAAAASQWAMPLKARGDRPYTVAVSGGRIAKKFFVAVAREAIKQPNLLKNVHFFWADERCVPPTDAESNFLLARQGLFDPAHVSPAFIHRIPGEKRPEEAAFHAIDEILTHCEQSEGIPVLDMVFLGMGEDGHVASLFPGTEVEELQREPLFFPVVASKPPPHRITIGYRVLARARNVWVLASGQGKQNALRLALEPSVKNPLGKVLELRSHTRVFSDIQES